MVVIPGWEANSLTTPRCERQWPSAVTAAVSKAVFDDPKNPIRKLPKSSEQHSTALSSKCYRMREVLGQGSLMRLFGVHMPDRLTNSRCAVEGGGMRIEQSQEVKHHARRFEHSNSQLIPGLTVVLL